MIKGKNYRRIQKVFVFCLLSILPLFVVAISESIIFYYVLWRPKYQRPGTRDASVGSSFVHKLPFGNILQSVRALSFKPIVSFSGVAELTRLSTLCAYNQRSNSPHAISEKQPGSHCAL